MRRALFRIPSGEAHTVLASQFINEAFAKTAAGYRSLRSLCARLAVFRFERSASLNTDGLGEGLAKPLSFVMYETIWGECL